ncbi:N,N-dimethylformamidase beta subunit family domain-containing protein [Planomonospora corallina]|uniref:N,N-dimethylformamidase beta subunit family domain-containing protein n=1 Tax=Planomonospora corallina TaxID=1806052 RepID=A0ABV8IA77_9ACTN
MTICAYAESTSVAQGGRLRFHLTRTSRAPLRGTVTVEDTAAGRRLPGGAFRGPHWDLDVPGDWTSSLYRAVFTSGEDGEETAEVHFVVRAARPASPILLSVPFPTWQAYNRAGIPGESLYWTEQPTRAARVSFDRPGGGPPPERWEEGMIRWLGPAGYAVDYCSGLDLHDGAGLLAGYRLLVVNGHDEYWSAGMRDSVEDFVRRGGNLAVFSGNTCWWQFRLEDGGRTMVCHRDAAADPVAATEPALTTVEWSSAPVDRPENGLIGVSFRRGAGTWGPYMEKMHAESYTVRFPEHWAFEGTGLGEGDAFGRGAIGYETDACDFTEVDGVPLATGRDGTPPSFVILATADLRHWDRYGQGGMATMGVMRLGAGTVFTAATVNWGNTLHDPLVARITRNVLDRLSGPAAEAWEVIGPGGPRDPGDPHNPGGPHGPRWPCGPLHALAAVGSTLYGTGPDGSLSAREICGQNLRWRPAGPAPGVVALASPREASPGRPITLYGLTADGRLVRRESDGSWTAIGRAPGGTADGRATDGRATDGRATDGPVTDGPVTDGPVTDGPVTDDGAAPGGPVTDGGTVPGGAVADGETAPGGPVGLAMVNGELFATWAGHLWCSAGDGSWTRVGAAPDVVALTAVNGRLYAVCADGRVRTRLPLAAPAEWTDLCDAGGATTLAAHAGRLIAASPGGPLRWRAAVPG